MVTNLTGVKMLLSKLEPLRERCDSTPKPSAPPVVTTFPPGTATPPSVVKSSKITALAPTTSTTCSDNEDKDFEILKLQTKLLAMRQRLL